MSRGALKDNEETETEGLRVWCSTRKSPSQTSSYSKVTQQADPMGQDIYPQLCPDFLCDPGQAPSCL